MKSVLISIQPKWCELIASGKKTLEVRKTRPKLETPFKCYIYCTKEKPGRKHQHEAFGICGKPIQCGGYVVAEFVCDEIKYHGMEDLIVKEDAERALSGSCLIRKQVVDYLGGKNTDYDYEPNRFDFYGWHISDLVIYDEPKELSEFTGLRKTKFGYEPVRVERAPPRAGVMWRRCPAMGEGVEMRFMDDPLDLCRVYMFKVRVSQFRQLNKYVALWFVVKYLWKAVRHGN